MFWRVWNTLNFLIKGEDKFNYRIPRSRRIHQSKTQSTFKFSKRSLKTNFTRINHHARSEKNLVKSSLPKHTDNFKIYRYQLILLKSTRPQDFLFPETTRNNIHERLERRDWRVQFLFVAVTESVTTISKSAALVQMAHPIRCQDEEKNTNAQRR